MITGLHQNARWAVGAWSKSNAQNRISYSGTATMVEGGPNVLQGTWIPKVGSGTKQGPSTARASMVRRGRFRSLGSFDAMDQTLFIEGYKLGMRSRPFPNIILPSIPFDEPRWLSAAKKAFRHRLPLIIRASAEPQDLPPPPSPDPDAAAFLVQDEPENGSEGDVQLLKVYPKLKHPLDHCLDIFFQNTSETDIFVVHDRTLVAAINEEHPLHLDLKEKVPRGSVNGDNQPIWNDASSSVPSIGPSSLFDVISEPSTGITTMPSTAHSSPYAYLPDDRRPESVSVGDDEIEDKPRFSKRRGEGGDRSSGNCVVQ
ncbi:hypothetical protein DL96DRAFT_263821 [Flagelloscypha sp. PMI_526]|nr:hypothetical protein DL96DRAFT_263821 [Flagelloscypha sp. PMI_526]